MATEQEMADLEHYEYAIIGGGKGGKTLAMALATAGHKTVLVERDKIGGSCIRVACIPSKTMVRSAQVMALITDAFKYGIDATPPVVLMDKVMARKRDVVEEMTSANWEQFKRSGMDFILGTAKFIAEKTFEVASYEQTRTIKANKIFIGTGSRPFIPKIYDNVKPLTSEALMNIAYVPDSLLVVGGGYIGLEFAQMFQRFGSEVILIERGEQLLAREDYDVSDAVRKAIEEDGIDVLLNTQVLEASRNGVEVELKIQTAKGERTISGAQVLVATGRIPNTEALNLKAAGVDTDERGFIKVNDMLETSAKDIWALGDVNGGPQFTHISLDDFRIVFANLNGGNRSRKDRAVPYTIFIEPELARVGITEKEAIQSKKPFRLAYVPMSVIPAAKTRGQMEGFMKAIIDKENSQVLGIAFFCAEAAEIMATVQVAMQARLPYTFLRDNVFAHPTLAEGLNMLFAENNIHEYSPELAALSHA
jgi:pyruvate/2-oxoglutarate dehydrogenase complex dihydrolipoamide dehydrogenase (E3) component